jgi:hypothetical protein
MLVPNIHELQGQNAGFFAVVGIKRDRSVIIKDGSSYMNAMQLCRYELSHHLSPLQLY